MLPQCSLFFFIKTVSTIARLDSNSAILLQCPKGTVVRRYTWLTVLEVTLVLSSLLIICLIIYLFIHLARFPRVTGRILASGNQYQLRRWQCPQGIPVSRTPHCVAQGPFSLCQGTLAHLARVCFATLTVTPWFRASASSSDNSFCVFLIFPSTSGSDSSLSDGLPVHLLSMADEVRVH